MKDKYENTNEACLFTWQDGKESKYSLESLQKDFRKGQRIKYLFFWGHQSSKGGNITKTCLSQWWMSSFKINTDTYCCMEQYMMAEKARLFNDSQTLEKIIKNNNPKKIKDLGRQVKNFDEVLWNEKRYSIIIKGNFAKFIQNEDLKYFLVQTKDKVLVEASPYDKIWGIGMGADDENVDNPLFWKGSNFLGFALMEVRDEIIRACKRDE